MLIQQLSLDAAFATLHSRPTGLSRADVASRRLEFGPNRIERLPATPLLVQFVSLAGAPCGSDDGCGACLTAIVVMQVVNVHLCRSRRRSIASRSLLDNPLITLGIVVELAVILAIDYTAAGNAAFGTVPLASSAWLFLLPFTAALLALEEGRKFVVRWRERTTIAARSNHALARG